MDPAEKESSYCYQYGRSVEAPNKICTFNLGSTTKSTRSECLNDESICTFLAEVEAIVNTRPIASESLSDVHSPATFVYNAVTDNEIKGCYATPRRVPEKKHVL